MRRLAALLGLVGTLVLLGAAPAHAQNPLDCKADPPLSSPRNGPAASLDSGPAEPTAEIPQAGNGRYGWYLSSGYAGYEWVDYDPGCGANDATDGEDDTERRLAGWFADAALSSLAAAVGLFGFIVRTALSDATLAVLDPFLTVGSVVFGGSVFLPGLAVTGGFAGLWFIHRSAVDSVQQTLSAAGTLLAIVSITLIAISFPIVAAKTFDRAITAGVGIVFGQAATVGANSASLIRQTQGLDPVQGVRDPDPDAIRRNPADHIITAVHDAVLVQTWRSGTFGRNNGKTADKFTSCLLGNSTRTFAEDNLPPEERTARDEEKAEQFKECADNLKEEDAAAYSYLAGHHNNERAQAAIIGWVFFLCVAVVLGGMLALIIFALVTLRIVIALTPLVGVIAVIPSYAHLFWQPIDYAVRRLVMAAGAVAVGAVYTVAVAALLNPASGVSLKTAVFTILVLNLGLFFVAREFKRRAKQAKAPRTGSAAAAEQKANADGGFGATSGAVPPERTTSAVGRAVRGAALGAVTAGPGGAAAGAAQGAAYGAMGPTGAGIATALAATRTARAVEAASKPADAPRQAPEGPAGPALPAGSPQEPGALPAAEVVDDGIDVFHPDSSKPEPPEATRGDDGTYSVWTPGGTT